MHDTAHAQTCIVLTSRLSQRVYTAEDCQTHQSLKQDQVFPQSCRGSRSGTWLWIMEQEGLRAALSFFSALSRPVFGDRLCPHCKLAIEKDHTYLEHLVETHKELQLDETRVQTLGAISESINETRHCTAASYTIRWDTGPRGVYLSTEPVYRRLAASAGKPDCTSAFPRCAGQLVAKGK